MSVNERVLELETKVAYQDKLIAELDEIVREFADRVTTLERKVAEQEASAETEVGPANDPPPHY